MGMLPWQPRFGFSFGFQGRPWVMILRSHSSLLNLYASFVECDCLSCVVFCYSLQCRHNEHDCVSNHRRLDCLLNHVFRRTSKKTSNLRVTGLCEGNSPVIGEFLTSSTSNAANVSIDVVIMDETITVMNWNFAQWTHHLCREGGDNPEAEGWTTFLLYQLRKPMCFHHDIQ